MSAPGKVRVATAYIACCVLWGSTWVAIKVGLRDLPPLLFAGTRMVLAAALLAPFAWRAGLPRLSARAFASIAGIGLLQIGVPYGMLFVGQQWVPAGLTAMLFSTFPVWLVLLARALLPDQPLTPRKLLAAALGLTGVAVLQIPMLRGGLALDAHAPVGGALIVGGAIVIAFANILVRERLRGFAPVALAFVQVLAGGALLLAASVLFESRLGWRSAVFSAPALLALVYLAVFGTAVTYLCLFWLIPRVPLSAIGAIPLVDTTIGVILGALLLHERVGWPLIVGGALVFAGAGIATQAAPAPAEPRPEAT